MAEPGWHVVADVLLEVFSFCPGSTAVPRRRRAVKKFAGMDLIFVAGLPRARAGLPFPRAGGRSRPPLGAGLPRPGAGGRRADGVDVRFLLELLIVRGAMAADSSWVPPSIESVLHANATN